MDKDLRKSYKIHKAQFLILNALTGPKSKLDHWYNQNVKDGIQSGVYMMNKESLTHFR